MLVQEIVPRLKKQNHSLGAQVVNGDGQICWLVDGVYMFHRDAADLARGRVTLAQITKSNAGKNIPRF
jgi:hypothetical protein